MPVLLPAGLTPTPILFEPIEVLGGARVTGYRFDLLDNEENLLGTLDGVDSGGLEWTAFTAIKGGGDLDVSDRQQDVDWLNARVRPMVLLSGVGAEQATEHGLGVFIAAAPQEQWTSLGRSWRIELLDKLAVLDQDIVTDLAGDPVTFVAPIGANVIETVVDLIELAGEAAPAITPDTKVLAASMVWDVGTPILQIINELLEAAGFSSLWSDGMGQYQVTPYVSPGNRPPNYSTLSPFVKGPTSLMSPDWERDRDIYSIPNRYVAISQGSGDEEALVAVATNEDPTSPFSFPSRGRWVTRVVTGVEATSQADLLARAKMGLAQSSSVTSGISIEHLYLPDLRINDTVKFTNPDAGLDLLCYVTKTSLTFDPTSMCKSEIREAVV